MEKSQPSQEAIIELGKQLVKELNLESGVDTLGKWMAHYVAELITRAEAAEGAEKEKIEKESYELILKLWEHRWSMPGAKPILKDFEPLLMTLEKLNPKKETPFFYSPRIKLELEREHTQKDVSKAGYHFKSALLVDKLARSIIYNLLNQAVVGIEMNSKRGELIRNAINLIDNPDTRIIRIISDYGKSLESDEGEDCDETTELIQELKEKIDNLEVFNAFKEDLLETYKKELATLKSRL